MPAPNFFTLAINRPSPCLPPHDLILLLLAAVACFGPLSASAEIRSISTNPAEDCSTQMSIGWHADLTETSCSVVYTQKSDKSWAHAAIALGSSQYSDIFAGIDSKAPDNTDWKEEARFLDYGATLTGLQPDTEYMYKIVPDDSNTTAPPRYFKTAGAPQFSFLWFSDAHAYTPIPARVKNLNTVLDAALEIDPSVDFMFSTGDVVAWGGSYSFWKKLFEQPFAANYMFADVIGNHDWMMRRNGGNSKFFAVAHNNPTNGYPGQEGICYWFIYSDVLFITLNNEEMKTNAQALADAKAWAADVIQKQKGEYKRIVLAEHYQWFDGRNGKTSWYAQWKDFCDEHHVTLALSGNNHVYQRTHTLWDDQVVSSGLGTVYMAAPSSDGERGVEAGSLTMNADKLACTYSSHLKSSDNQVKTIGCVLVDVSPDSIKTRLVYLDDNGQVQTADETVITTLTADAPQPGLPPRRPALPTSAAVAAPETTSGQAME